MAYTHENTFESSGSPSNLKERKYVFLEYLTLLGQGNYIFNAEKPPEYSKSFFLKLSPIFTHK